MNRILIVLLAIATVALAAVAVFGKSGEVLKHRTASMVFIALDGSDSGTEALDGIERRSYEAQKSLDHSTEIVLLPFANDVEIAYKGPGRMSRKAYKKVARQALERLAPPSRTPGTRIDRVLEHIAVTGPKDQSFSVELHFDGGLEDQSDQMLTRIRHYAEQIATAPNCKGLVIVGVQQRHRRFWEDLLGRHATIRGENDGH